MSEYSPPPGSERFAELVHRQRIESAGERERLADAPSERLRQVLLDRRESRNARGNALGIHEARCWVEHQLMGCGT